MLLVQYIGKQQHQKLYMRGQLHQTFCMMLTLAYPGIENLLYYTGCIGIGYELRTSGRI